MNDRSHAPIDSPRRRFLDGEFEAGARSLALRSEQALQIFRRAVLVAGPEKKYRVTRGSDE